MFLGYVFEDIYMKRNQILQYIIIIEVFANKDIKFDITKCFNNNETIQECVDQIEVSIKFL